MGRLREHFLTEMQETERLQARQVVIAECASCGGTGVLVESDHDYIVQTSGCTECIARDRGVQHVARRVS